MELQVVVMVDDEWPNGLPISCAAALDRENGRLLPAFKKAPILLDAQRRRLKRIVRRSFPNSKTMPVESTLLTDSVHHF